MQEMVELPKKCVLKINWNNKTFLKDSGIYLLQVGAGGEKYVQKTGTLPTRSSRAETGLK
jgi:hypothetical protein